MADSLLPVFRKPPVVETVLGVQFDPIPGFSNAYLGAFWKWLVAGPESSADWQWLKTIDAPPVEPVFERFEENQVWSPDELKIRVERSAALRLQIRNPMGDAMIQVQDTRFHYNWIGQRGADYQRYQKVRPAFDRAYGLFQRFLSAEKLSLPNENQWEVTYVNHIRQGTVWSSPDDWVRLFAGLPGPWIAVPDLQPESVGGAWHFRIPPRRGRLHVELKHARLEDTEAGEILRMTLTARGPISRGETSLAEGLDLGRRIIVHTFAKITSSEAHRFWERIQ